MSINVNSQTGLIRQNSFVSVNNKNTSFSALRNNLSQDTVNFSGKKKRHPIRNGLLGLGALLTVITAPLTGCKPNDSNTQPVKPPTVAEQTVDRLQRIDKDFLVNKDNVKMPLNAEKLAKYVQKMAESNAALAEKHRMELVGMVISEFTPSQTPGDYSQDVVNTYAEKNDASAETLVAVPARITKVTTGENGEPVLTVINYVYGKATEDLSREIARINENLKEVDPSNPACNEGGSFAIGVGTGMLLSD